MHRGHGRVSEQRRFDIEHGKHAFLAMLGLLAPPSMTLTRSISYLFTKRCRQLSSRSKHYSQQWRYLYQIVSKGNAILNTVALLLPAS